MKKKRIKKFKMPKCYDINLSSKLRKNKIKPRYVYDIKS